MAPFQNHFRPEIQGLRAIAVLAVLVYHLWPSVLPGGYVGVDVFFVISGYLITGVLLREVIASGTVSVAAFYQRRIKRLLPAATVTILGTALAHNLLPVVSWANAAKDTIASTLYVQNWWLARRATNYLAHEDASGPLQHYWSLSVEEQYYIIWPLIIVLTAFVARRLRKSPRAAIAVPLAIIGLVSLAYSIYLSRTDVAWGYFATSTRAWELTLGGAIAFLPAPGVTQDRACRALAAAGLGMIAAACFVFNSQTLFPGYAALLPTMGAAAIIVAGRSESPWSLYHLLKQRPFQYYGDISYSLYLWHWPVVVFYKQLAGREPTLVDGLLIFFVSGALAHQTKTLVEDYFRRPGRIDKQRWRTFLFAGVCMSLSVGAGMAVLHSYSKHLHFAPYAGIGETGGVSEMSQEDRLSAALRARDDVSPAYKRECIASKKTITPAACISGKLDSDFHVALVGDSHAVNWEPAFTALAEERSWKLSLFAKSACSLADQSVGIGIPKVYYESCDAYRTELVRSLIEIKPDIVVLAQSRGYDAYKVERRLSKQALADGLVRTIRQLETAGVEVILMSDSPRMAQDTPECLSNPQYASGGCDTPAVSALNGIQDPALLAGARAPSLKLASMTRHFCAEDKCRAVIDGMVVYRDRHHLAATFVRSLAPHLLKELAKHAPRLLGDASAEAP